MRKKGGAMKKIVSIFLAFALAVHISISFAEQQVTLTIDKGNMENVAGIEVFQNDDTEPVTAIDTTLPKPWQKDVTLVSINGVLKVYAVPVDTNGARGTRSPDYTILDGSDITINITGQ
jgi:uncharacterized membrane protein YvbJ